MNIFILDEDINKCAEYHCDQHVIKMILESAQMLCTVLHNNGFNAPYKATHKKHPCTIWAGDSLSNWRYLKKLALLLNEQYKKRYNKNKNHKSADIILNLPEPDIKDIGLTPFKKCMPDKYKSDSAIESYRNYYINEKVFAKWRNKKPYWFVEK